MKKFKIALMIGALLLAGTTLCFADEEDEGWKQRFLLDLSGSAGNTDSFDMRTGWRANQRTERRRRWLDATYYLGFSDGHRDQSAFTSGVKQDWLVPDATWFAFGQGRYDFDDFRAWRHRVSSHWGLGDELRKTETFELLGRLGVGASKQWERTEDIQPEGLLGLDLLWEITDASEFVASSYMYPELDDFFEYRLVSNAEFNAEIDHQRGMSLIAGVEHEYESSVGKEVKNWDLRYYAGISIAF